MSPVPERLAAALADRYRIERELGQGGMATVYLAHDIRHNRHVALKVVRPDVAEGMGSERFLREIHLAAGLHHPNIMPLYDSGNAAGFLYYVMPVAEGESLSDRLGGGKQLGIADAVRLGGEVADALDYAHRHGVIHRDIKPGNILLHEGHALVTDFGIGKALSAAAGSATLTQTGLAIGTPAYMSPEQAGGDPSLDGRSDLYSLGCVLYEMLAGTPPFTGATVGAVIAKRFTESPPDVRAARAEVPPALSDVVRRCLAREPNGRYATGAALTAALGQSTASMTATTVSGAERARSRLPWIAVLPFVTRDPSLAELAEGLAEDITNGLSQFSHLQVVAHQSAAHLPPGTDVRRLGEVLGARYAVEGNLRKSGSTVRLSVQLVDVSTGVHLWAETFDRDLGGTSIFALQDDLTDRIVVTVADPFGVLVRAMGAALRDRPIDQLTASEMVIRVWAYSYQVGPEEHARLRDGLERAVEREPEHADAWAALADIYWEEQLHGHNLRPDALGRARHAAQRAVEIDPASQFGWAEVALVNYFSGDLAAFRPAAERALALNPRNSGTGAILATAMAFGGDWERGHALMRRLMDLNPQHAGWFHFVPFHYHFKKGEYQEALAAAKRVNMPQLPWTYTTTMSVCAALGRWDEARQAADSLRRLFPTLAPNLGRGPSGWFYDRELEDRENVWMLKALALKDTDPAAAPTTQSVAVLPFANMSGSADDEYFSDGISEEIINALTQLPGLRVAARTSAFSFKGKNEDLRSVGDKLGVTTVLEGSVRRSGSKLRITAQLINVADGYHLWSERFDRENTDIFAIQDEIAGAIASKLKVTMAGGVAGSRKRQATTNLEAYELYLKGKSLIAKRGESLRGAIECLERATALDPEFAAAQAALGEALALLGHYGLVRAATVIPRAKALLQSALAREPGLADAHAALALITMAWDRDYPAAEAGWKLALELNPNSVPALTLYGAWYLGMLKCRFRDAAAMVARARELDPLSALVQASYALVLAVEPHPDAVTEARRAVELDPDAYLPHYVLVTAYMGAGRWDDAIAASEPALAVSNRHPWVMTWLASALFKTGRTAEALVVKEELFERSRTGYVPASMLAMATSSTGDIETGVRMMWQAYEEQDTTVVTVGSMLKQWPPAVQHHPEVLRLARAIGWAE